MNNPMSSIYRFAKFNCVFFLILVFLISCAKKQIDLNLSGENAAVYGKITYKGKPVNGAQVYAYETPGYLRNKNEKKSSDIEDILRDQVREEELAVEEWVDEESFDEEKDAEDYPEFHGPADFKSASSGENGEFSLVLSPGTYCFVARRRKNPEIAVGPLTPEDYSSLVSYPFIIESGDILNLDFDLEYLNDETINFFSRFAIKTKETEIRGIISDRFGQPVSGLCITANKNLKVSAKPDYFSRASNEKGEFILNLPGTGVYYLSLRNKPFGDFLDSKFKSAEILDDNSLEIDEGETLENVKVIFNGQFLNE